MMLRHSWAECALLFSYALRCLLFAPEAEEPLCFHSSNETGGALNERLNVVRASYSRHPMSAAAMILHS